MIISHQVRCTVTFTRDEQQCQGDAATHFSFRKPSADWGEGGGDESVAATEGTESDLVDVSKTARAVRKEHNLLVVSVSCARPTSAPLVSYDAYD